MRRVEAGLRRAPDLLKMDIEGFEYETLASTLALSGGDDGALLPQQILLEIHEHVREHYYPSLTWAMRRRTAAEHLAFALQLYSAGYRLSHVDWETVSPYALEVTLSRIYC